MSPFSLSPFLTDTSNIKVIDYTTKDGKVHYRVATAALDRDGFLLEPNDCLAMLNLFTVRAASMGWDRPNGCLMIMDNDEVAQSLISQYAVVTTENVTMSKTVFMGTENASRKTRTRFTNACTRHSPKRQNRSSP